VLDEGTPYRRLSPAQRAHHLIGQIFWIPAFVALPNLYVIRLGKWDRLTPIFRGEFQIEKCSLPQIGHNLDVYHHMPISELKLQMNEELVVRKAKRRPSILVFRDGIDTRRMATFFSGIGDKPNPGEHIFAPIVSLRKEANLGTDYPPGFIAKVREGEIPELIYLPPDGTVIKNESMAVLSQLQCHSIGMIEETPLQMDPFAFAIYLDDFWQRVQAELLPDG
jgi:hypothetical protein